jgi:NADH-quinone oxidoreductase subunit E
MMKTEILAILKKEKEDQGGLISILQDIQARYGYLPADALKMVASETGRPLVDVYGAATFYRAFSLKPHGKHLVTICQGTACHVRGAARVREELVRKLGIEPAQTTPDRQFTLEAVNCVGACALAPIVVVDGEFHGQMTATKVDALIRQVQEQDAAGTRGE